MARPRRTMGLEAGHRPLTQRQLSRAYNSFGPSHAYGRVLATVEMRDKRLAKIQRLTTMQHADGPRDALDKIRALCQEPR